MKVMSSNPFGNVFIELTHNEALAFRALQDALQTQGYDWQDTGQILRDGSMEDGFHLITQFAEILSNASSRVAREVPPPAGDGLDDEYH